MLIPIYKNKFSKDVKRLKKRNKDLSKLKFVINELIAEKTLIEKYRNHSLKGEYADCCECHIEPDWLLVYMVSNPHIIFIRTGTHADLFR